MACFADPEPYDDDGHPVTPHQVAAMEGGFDPTRPWPAQPRRVTHDRYAREVPLDQWGQPVPTVWLDDIRFRRYNLIRREPLGDVARGIDSLLEYLDQEVYSEPLPNGGRTLREGIDPLRALAVVAHRVEELGRSMSRVDVQRLAKEWLNAGRTHEDVADRSGGGGLPAVLPLAEVRAVGDGGDPGHSGPGGLVRLEEVPREVKG